MTVGPLIFKLYQPASSQDLYLGVDALRCGGQVGTDLSLFNNNGQYAGAISDLPASLRQMTVRPEPVVFKIDPVTTYAYATDPLHPTTGDLIYAGALFYSVSTTSANNRRPYMAQQQNLPMAMDPLNMWTGINATAVESWAVWEFAPAKRAFPDKPMGQGLYTIRCPQANPGWLNLSADGVSTTFGSTATTIWQMVTVTDERSPPQTCCGFSASNLPTECTLWTGGTFSPPSPSPLTPGSPTTTAPSPRTPGSPTTTAPGSRSATTPGSPTTTAPGSRSATTPGSPTTTDTPAPSPSTDDLTPWILGGIVGFLLLMVCCLVVVYATKKK